MGDGECAEGSVWEAASFASHYKLDNLIAIVDVNRLGQSAPTQLQHNVSNYQKRFEAFGFETIVIDGHNVEQIIKAFEQARNTKDKPFCIISQTLKGKYFLKDVEDVLSWHGKPLGNKAGEVISHLKSMMKNQNISLTAFAPNSSTNGAVLLEAKITLILKPITMERNKFPLGKLMDKRLKS